MGRKSRRLELASGASIPAIVRHAHRGARVARWGEAGLLGAAGLCLTLAAGELSNGGVSRAGTWIAAGLVGALVVGTWLAETSRSVAQTARELDRRLGFGGALLTAHEAQAAGRAGELVDLLAARVAARLSPSVALSAARPLTAFPIVAPFLAAAALALAMEASHPAATSIPYTQLAQSLSEKIALARGTSLDAMEAGERSTLGEQPEQVPARLTELYSSVAKLEAEWRREAPEPAVALAGLDRLERELAQLAAELPASSPLAEDLRELETLLDAAALRARDAQSGGRFGASEANPRGGSLVSGETRGRMEASEASPTAPTARSSEATLGRGVLRERGAGVALEWQPEYDEIVALWVESRRAVERQ